MAGNIFDQFDTRAAPQSRGAAAMHAPSNGGNVFDQFDAPPPGNSSPDEFAADTPASPNNGFATRAQREGSDSDLRQAGYLADAVRIRQEQDRGGVFGNMDAAARGFAGWIPGMDKLAAGADAAIGLGDGQSFGERYSTNLERQRAMDEADKLMNPAARYAGQGAGLVGTAMVLPGVNVVKEGVRGAATVNAAATGGLYGAATGAVESDGGAADKALAGLQGAALGGAIGGAAPTFVRGAEAFARATGKLASNVSAPFRSAVGPEREAARRINEALARDGVTDPAARLAELQSTGANAVIGDIGGETTRRLARSASNLSSEAGEALSGAVSDRFASQGDRVVDILKGFGPSSAGKTLDELQAAARKSNAPAYEFFRRQSEKGAWTPELENLAQAPAVQDAIRSVVKTGANKTVVDGMPPIRNPFTTDAAGNLQLARQADGSIAYPNGQFWDYVQRELRGKAGEAARSGNNDLARDYGNLRKGLVNHLDELFPAFKTARSGAAHFFQAEDALEAGQKFVMSRMANDEARKAVGRMPPAERELFAEGFRSDLIAKIREIGDGRDVVKSVFGNPAMRERVEIALGKNQATQLQAALTVESALLPLQAAVKGNSTTIQQLLMSGAAASAPAAVGGAAGFLQGRDTASAVAGALTGAALRRGNTKIQQGLAKEIGKMLASGDLKMIQRATKVASQSPSALRFVQDFADEAAKLGGLSASPLEVTVRPRGAPVNLPAAANDEQQ
ncbi:hypothetical protein [Bosea sp. (in: a-proteobacteria)]|jgi:hypothetical protein|uniref:hypothetical protein n=1 Tax=Bosea sp. (in: a-proteobacteria) TaxID=1871050 RepID=UPI002DDDB2D0|nr:hypothetical protein [Bosea sp. (in: a-proteobacteria)]HEV2508634.1 hypothetical protein [Bosea sp. (in: a-proteobacteria)]